MNEIDCSAETVTLLFYVTVEADKVSGRVERRVRLYSNHANIENIVFRLRMAGKYYL